MPICFLTPVLAFGLLRVTPAVKNRQTASGTLNVQLTNASVLLMTLNSNASGVALGNAGTNAATLDFGTVADYATPHTGVSQTSGKNQFTVSTPFYVLVESGGSSSANYALTASLAAAAPTGVTISMNNVTLSTTAKTVTASGAYSSNQNHTVKLQISTAPSGSGGPITGSQITSTINLTATAN